MPTDTCPYSFENGRYRCALGPKHPGNWHRASLGPGQGARAWTTAQADPRLGLVELQPSAPKLQRAQAVGAVPPSPSPRSCTNGPPTSGADDCPCRFCQSPAAVRARAERDAARAERDRVTLREKVILADRDAVLAAARRLSARLAGAAQVEREACIKVVEEWAANYPTSVFPEGSTSTDGISAAMARHTCKMLVEKLRERSPEPHPARFALAQLIGVWNAMDDLDGSSTPELLRRFGVGLDALAAALGSPSIDDLAAVLGSPNVDVRVAQLRDALQELVDHHNSGRCGTSADDPTHNAVMDRVEAALKATAPEETVHGTR